MQTRHPRIGRRHLEYVSCGSIGEFPETRQRRGERAEGAEVVRAAVAADGRSIKPEQPGDGPFGHPTVSAEFLAGLDTLAGDAYADALPTHPAAMVSLIVGFVGIRIRMTSGLSAQASLVESRSCLRTGLGLVRDLPFRADGCTVADRAGPVDHALATRFVKDRAMQSPPQASSGPLGEPAMRGGHGDSERGWEMTPGAAAGHDEHHGGEHRTVIHRCRAATLRTRAEPRNQRPGQRPQLVGYQLSRQRVDHRT